MNDLPTSVLLKKGTNLIKIEREVISILQVGNISIRRGAGAEAPGNLAVSIEREVIIINIGIGTLEGDMVTDIEEGSIIIHLLTPNIVGAILLIEALVPVRLLQTPPGLNLRTEGESLWVNITKLNKSTYIMKINVLTLGLSILTFKGREVQKRPNNLSYFGMVSNG